MKRIFLITICLLMLAGCARAEQRVSLGGEGYNALTHPLTLPDGRVLLAGSQSAAGRPDELRARLVCLNPDRTVAWEYLDPAQGSCAFSGACLLPDGAIGTVFMNSPKQTLKALELRRFNTDGTPAGAPVDIFEPHALVDAVTPACVQVTVIPGDAQVYDRRFLDWNGRRLFSLPSDQRITGGILTMDMGGALALAGRDTGYPTGAKLMMLGMDGRVRWETALPTFEDNADARLERCIATSDGGFLAWLHEVAMDGARHTYALVRFSPKGRVLWTQRAAFDGLTGAHCTSMIEQDGRYVIALRKNLNDHDAVPLYVQWFDGEGAPLGEAETRLQPGENGFGGQLLPMPDGLWLLRDVEPAGDSRKAGLSVRSDVVLIKAPGMAEAR